MVRQRPWSDHRRVARVGARYENQQTADNKPGQKVSIFRRSSAVC
jgi:hypothetical protein